MIKSTTGRAAVRIGPSLEGSPNKGTERDDFKYGSYCRRRTHHAALSRSLAGRNVVTTPDIGLTCDTLNSIAFDGHRSAKIERCFMWTAF